MRKKQIVLVVLFFAMLILPTVIFVAFKPFADSENLEKRTLVTFEDVVNAPYIQIPATFTSFLNDNLPFKTQLTELNSLVSMSVFNTTANPKVMVGKDGWLFYNNIGLENPIDDVIGVTTFSGEEIEKIKYNIETAEKYLKEQDTELYILLAPNKENICFSLLPDYIYEIMAPISRAGLLAESIAKTDLNFAYPKPELELALSGQQLYYKYDSHWNACGAYVGTRVLFDMMGIELPPLESYDIESLPGGSTDLADMAAITANCKDDPKYTLNFESGVSYSGTEIAYGTNLYTSNASDKRTVLVIGDSYFHEMEPYLAKTFATVIAVNRNAGPFDPYALIEEYKPDIIVIEVVERGCSILLHDDILL